MIRAHIRLAARNLAISSGSCLSIEKKAAVQIVDFKAGFKGCLHIGSTIREGEGEFLRAVLPASLMW